MKEPPGDPQPKITKRLSAALRMSGYQIRTISGPVGLPMVGPRNWNQGQKIFRYILVSPTGRSVLSASKLKDLMADIAESSLP